MHCAVWEIVAGSEPHENEDNLFIGVKIRDEGFAPEIPEDCDTTLREAMLTYRKMDPKERPVRKVYPLGCTTLLIVLIRVWRSLQTTYGHINANDTRISL